jgi:predicted Zn-dependent peptidase
VFTIVLGGGMSSRLFQEVREKRGLCYTISAFHAPYSDTGMFGIYAGTDAGDVKELMRVAWTRPPPPRQHHRGRGQPRQGADQGRPADGAGELGARARQLASQILTYGRPLPIEEMVARIDNVSVASTRAAGSALMARARPAIAALGPV